MERTAQILRAAGDPGRLKLLLRLGRQATCVTDLAHHFGVAPSTISQQLRTLSSAGLIARRREGKRVYYSLADEDLAALIRSGLRYAQDRA